MGQPSQTRKDVQGRTKCGHLYAYMSGTMSNTYCVRMIVGTRTCKDRLGTTCTIGMTRHDGRNNESDINDRNGHNGHKMDHKAK